MGRYLAMGSDRCVTKSLCVTLAPGGQRIIHLVVLTSSFAAVA